MTRSCIEYDEIFHAWSERLSTKLGASWDDKDQDSNKRRKGDSDEDLAMEGLADQVFDGSGY